MYNIFKKKKLNVFLVYFSLIAIIYAQVFFFGKSLLAPLYYPSDNLSDFYKTQDKHSLYLEWQKIRSLGKTQANNFYNYKNRKPINTFNIDLATPAFESIPMNRLVGNMYLQGNLPLWNPYNGCGTPLAAQYSTRVFFPYQILVNIFPWWMWDYFMLGRLVIAGFFVYLFLETLGLSTLVSFLGGIFFMLSGSMVWFINYEAFTNVAITVPIFFFCLEKMIKYKNNFYLVLCSIAMTLVLLAGQPEIAIYIFLLAGVYYAFRLLMKDRLRCKLFKNFFIMFILGLGLAAFLILPFLELELNSFNCHKFGGNSGIRSPAHPGHFLFCLMPYVSEAFTFYRVLPHNGDWDYLGGYTGVLMLYLMLSGLFYRKNQYHKYLLFFSLAGFLIVLKNFNFPLISWIGYLPFLNQSWSPRWAGPVWTFCFACAGAIGIQIILDSEKRKKLICWTISLCFILLILCYYYPLLSSRFKHDADLRQFMEVSPTLFLGAIVASLVLCVASFLIIYCKIKKDLILSLIILSVLELWFCIPKGTGLQWQLLRLIPFVIGIFSVLLFIKGKKTASVILITFTAIAAILIDICSFYGFPERQNIFSEKPYIKFLKSQKDYYRIMGYEGVLMPNSAGVFELFDVRYIDALSPSIYQNFVDKHLRTYQYYNDTDSLWFTGITDIDKTINHSVYEDLIYNINYFSFLGVKYVLVPSGTKLNLPLVYNDEVRIYENPSCLPRVFIVHDIEYASSYKIAQIMMGDKNFNFKNKVILEEKISQEYNKFLPIDSSKANIKEYHPEKVVIEAYLGHPGILVLTDIFYPEWKAYVDGRETKIYRVNGLVRGILLGQGNHVVIFKYFPNSFKIGLIASGICFILCLVLMGNKSKNINE